MPGRKRRKHLRSSWTFVINGVRGTLWLEGGECRVRADGVTHPCGANQETEVHLADEHLLQVEFRPAALPGVRLRVWVDYYGFDLLRDGTFFSSDSEQVVTVRQSVAHCAA